MESAKASACQNLIQASTWMPVRRGWKRQKDAKAANPDSSIQPLHTNTLQYLFVQSISINPKVSWMATTGWLTPGLLVKGGVHLMGNGQLVISWYTIQSHWKPPRNNQRFTCHGVGTHFLMQFRLLRFCCNLTGRLMATGNVLLSRRGLHPPNAGSQTPFKLT